MKVYIYKMVLNRRTAEMILDQEKMHKFLTALIGTDRASANLLYRLDIKHDLLFVQSDVTPMTTSDLQLLHVIDVDSLLENYHDGDDVTLRVAMVVSYSYGGKLHYVPTEHIPEWLARRMQSYGLSVKTYRDFSKTHLTYQHEASRGGKHEITVHDLLINGTIADKNTFMQHWHEGFGKHRAYGAGLAVMVQ